MENNKLTRPRGRPRKKDPRGVQKQVRWKQEEWDLVEEAAKLAGFANPSEFIRHNILKIVGND